ncbi:uncharacterized protein LOC120775303 isoform X1 [Bactrocera tryoni]|uniref:uncharacterized protein LOC120775303 isoform X1 n=1 Tax=Bactrocera tryoni TaxID=59916 RepID=UPI001A99337C|nr:uncharacterized protein LOC120775303 isoform X1 [Bactrocera tryoni]
MSSKSVYCKLYKDDPEDIKTSNKRRNRWTEDSERLFLQLWRSNLDELRACKKNSHILMEIVVEMELQGFKYSLIEMKTKMHNMTSKYRRERIEVRTTGIPSLWEHYDVMNSLITEYENDRRNSLDIDHSNAKKIKFDHENPLLMPEKNHNTPRDSKSSWNDNNFDTLSESDNSVEKNVGHNVEDMAESNNYSISVRGNLKSTKNSICDNYCSKVQNTNRSIVVETNGHDDMDLFFLSMSKTVRKLPHHVQVHLKRKICNLVFEAELKDLKPSNVDDNDL